SLPCSTSRPRFPGEIVSKGLKKVATIVGIAALAYFTFGVGSALLGGATIGAAIGSASALGALTFSTVGSLGLGLLAIGSSPDLPKSLENTGANSRGTAFAD